MKQLKACTMLLLAALAAATLTGCIYINMGGEAVIGNGKVETRDIDLKYEVTGIRNQSAVNVVIDMDLQGKAVFEAESNLIEIVNVSQQSDGVVTVDVKPATVITVTKPMTLRIPAMEGGRIEANGSGNITQAEGTLAGESFDVCVVGSGDIRLSLEAERLSLSINGSGDIELSAAANITSADSSGSGDIAISGETQSLEVSMNGSGIFSGFDFAAQYAQVDISGSGDANVNVAEGLTGSINGSGDITYDGNPQSVSISDKGSGDARER